MKNPIMKSPIMRSDAIKNPVMKKLIVQPRSLFEIVYNKQGYLTEDF